MKVDTNHRIEAYRQALPQMRERVAAAFLMLVIAATVAVTATYAWVTLSLSPEVSGMATTLAANGNLEIALAKADGSAPDEFDVDESVSLSNTDDVTVSNLQWGNLVNLSDTSYGIDKIALRPARLNTANLLGNPLWGAVYSADGRVTNLDSNYAYVKDNGKDGFVVDRTNSYGVRAIASYKAEIAGSTQSDYNEKDEAVRNAHQVVNQKYDAVAGTFASLGDMISAYAQDKLSSTNTDLGSYFGQVLQCYYALEDAMEAQKDAYVAMANFQNYVYINNFNSHNETQLTYEDTTWENIEKNKAKYNVNTSGSTSQDGHIALTGLNQFINDLATLKSDISWMEKYKVDHETRLAYNADTNPNGSAYYWGEKDANTPYPSGPNISSIVDRLVGVYTMTADLKNDGNETVLVSLGTDDISGLLSAVAGGDRKVYIYNGIMIRFEQNAVSDAYRLNGDAKCTIKIKFGITVSVNGKAYTKAYGDCNYWLDYNNAAGEKLIPADATAEDTYGLVVDLWLRTNAEETCLTLEGAVATDTETGKVMSFDGVNRVWGETGTETLTTNSTTQGGGSCYVYYTDSPEDMARSLNLLEAMKVAFVDSNGKLLATANMDTENYYAVNGRVTVPLVLNAQSGGVTYTYTDGEDSTEMTGRGITTMYADKAIRITAIIYLDGDRLSNDDVLAESTIQGRLNIQFGSSQALDTKLGNEFKYDKREVTAEVSNTEINFDTAGQTEKTVTVTVKVVGDQPEKITAHFLRAINDTQGTQEEEMVFAKGDGGTWTTSYEFKYPGTYHLRYVTLDGVEYTLNEPQTVTVSGFALASVAWSEVDTSYSEDRKIETATIRTSDSTHTTTVTVAFAADKREKEPSVVEARFVREDGNTVNVPMRRDGSGNWNGSATFNTSGIYTLQYLLLDGRYHDLTNDPITHTRVIDLSLGMYVRVTNVGGKTEEMFEAGKSYGRDVTVKIFDNVGTELGPDELGEDVTPWLYYTLGSSGTNTVPAELKWSDTYDWYTGTLPFVNAGIYNFGWVELGSSTLSRCSESPTYRFVSPNPPVYDTSSSCTNNVDGIQYVPLATGATIEGLKIAETSAATVKVVVYNETYGQFQDATATVNGESITITLPTYQLPTGDKDDEGKDILAPATQEGKWHVAAIYISNCYDASGTYREDNAEKFNPIIWVDSGEYGAEYLDEVNAESQSVTADERIDFSALSTTVSSKVTVSMDAGTTALGSSTTAFGTVHAVSKTGMSVTVKDGSGNKFIPANKIDSVVLNVNYNGNSNTSYGYAVSGENKAHTIMLTRNADTGAYTADASTEQWYYVGEYTVTSLVVTFTNGKYVTYDGGDTTVGVPTMYTVTSEAPTAEDIKVTNTNGEEGKVTQTITDFGVDKNGNNVTGTFLESYNLDATSVKLSLKGAGNADMSYVVLPDVTVKLNLTHTANTSSAYGGYTVTDEANNSYREFTMDMNKDGSYYRAGSHVLLAGEYTGKVVVTMNGVSEEYPLEKTIKVYSKKPDVTMALASGTPPTVTVNKDAGTTVSTNTFTGNNQILNNGHSALLYIAYKPFTAENNVGKYNNDTSTKHSADFADYTLPSVAFKLSDAGSTCTSFTLNIPGSGSVVLDGTGSTATGTIGSITTGTDTREEARSNIIGGTDYVKFTYNTEVPNAVGEQIIKTITATDTSGTYILTLATALQLVQNNSTPPSITFAEQEGFATPAGEISADGTAFAFTLPTVTQYGTVTSKGENTSIEVETGDSQVLQELPSISNTLIWETISSELQKKVYTVDYELKSDSHYVVWDKDTYYWRTGTQQMYLLNSVTQRTTAVRLLSGTTVTKTTVKKFDRETVLEYWLVNGTRYEPGATITAVNGNWVAVPVLKTTDAVYETVVTTATTVGQTLESYVAECSAVVAVKETEKTGEDSTKHCGHSTGLCEHSAEGSKAKSNAEKWTMAAPNGYELVNSVPTDIARTLDGVEWKLESSGPVEGSGTTTTTIQVYDANGKLLSTTTN